MFLSSASHSANSQSRHQLPVESTASGRLLPTPRPCGAEPQASRALLRWREATWQSGPNGMPPQRQWNGVDRGAVACLFEERAKPTARDRPSPAHLLPVRKYPAGFARRMGIARKFSRSLNGAPRGFMRASIVNPARIVLMRSMCDFDFRQPHPLNALKSTSPNCARIVAS